MQYDKFQQRAIDYINNGYSVIVSAPTGAGKTVIAEHVIQDCLLKGERVVYTAPIKALSNQKFRDFQVNFPDKVGILTGDVTINAQASTLIMTTEIFRNKILEENRSLEEYAWIIFDEIHYLDDYERGCVWEESLMFLPSHMKVLGLSATIPNIDELAGWFQSIHHRPLKIVKENKRPVPLHFFYQCQNKIYDDFQRMVKEGFKTKESIRYRHGRIPRYISIRPNRISSLMQHLMDNQMLPCIYFVFSRRRTEYLAEEVFSYNFLTEEEKQRIKEIYDDLCSHFDLIGDPGAERLRPFVERGIAYHHAGMLPTLKEVVERLFTSRLIKFIATTETFALGINMPAKTVIFDELRKFYGHAYSSLRTRDFYQMAGRAGRRGIDPEGFVISRINPHYISPPEVHRIIFREPEEVRSRFNASYATLLNLYQKYAEKLYDIYPLSFHYYQEVKRRRKRAVDTLRAKVGLLKDYGYIRKNKVTPKGLFASRVYGYEFILSELYEQGVLENLGESSLGVLAAAVVFEPRKGTRKPSLSRQAKRLQAVTDRIIKEVHRRERRLRIRPLSKQCFYHLSSLMEHWLKGESFDEVLGYADVDEGEVVRYLRMSVQILREILDAPVSEELKDRIYHVIRLINRDVVDAEKQLRG